MQPKSGLGEEAESSRTRQGPPVALTIAGFDPSSGAGVTADLKVFAAHGLFGVSAITSLTVQSTLGVAAVQPINSGLLAQTLGHLWADLPAAGIKIGMLASEAAVRVVAQFLRGILSGQETGQPLGKVAGKGIPIVLDPVLRSSSGHELLPPAALEALQTELLPLVASQTGSQAGWITPNWIELGLLAGSDVGNLAEARAAAEALGLQYPGLHLLATGGEMAEPVDLLRTQDGHVLEFVGERIETRSTHGTGCAFSSAVLARLVLGDRPAEAIAGAKAYVAEALRSAPGLGHGRGPLNLLWPLRR